MTSPRRKRARKYISLRERLAAALSMLLPQEQRDELRASKAPAKTVIALFHTDHNILHALGGADRWWNLTPMLRQPHKEKSRRDTSIVAKVRRVSKEHQEFRRNLLKSKRRKRKSKHKIPSRPFPKAQRPLRSRAMT